jgi:Barstar (barnase inhibitor)
MEQLQVIIECERITDAASFHDVFAETFGFARYYGRNMDAWIDIMGDLADPIGAQSAVRVSKDGVLLLYCTHTAAFRQRCPSLYADLVECTAFVNRRRIAAGTGVMIALAFDS